MFLGLVQRFLKLAVFRLQTLDLRGKRLDLPAGILAALCLLAQDGQLLAQLVVLAAQVVPGAGQFLRLGLIFLGDLFNISDHILPVEAAKHTRSEIHAHSILRFA